MAKFGELIDIDVPVLIEFYRGSSSSSSLESILNTVAQELKARAKVVRIDINKNRQLTEALRISELPTLMIYSGGEMVWRQGGEPTTANELVEKLNSLH